MLQARRSHAPGRELLCLAAYAVLAAIATYPLVLHLRTAIPGADDAFQFYWNLWWVKRARVVLHVNPYAIGDLYFPYGAHLYFHTLNLLQDVIALPIALLLGLPAAYNFVVFLSFMLSGYAVYRLSLYVLEQEVDPGGVVVHARAARRAAFVAGAAFAPQRDASRDRFVFSRE